jgi:hypothetical protein
VTEWKEANSSKNAVVAIVRCRLFTRILIGTALLQPNGLVAEPIAVRHLEGTVHGFLTLRTLSGDTIAAGDLIQVIQSDRVVSSLIFRFKDGSIDDETAIFSQRQSFRLINYRHVQKGPAFPNPMDVSIDVSTGQTRVSFSDDGKEKVETDRRDLPPDLANGLVLTIVKNIRPDAAETKLSYVAATPKPRLVKLAIAPQGEEAFSVGGARHKAVRFVVRVELGGLTGVMAKLLGKQPQDTHVWVLGGKAPAFVKSEGPFYQGGPIWRIELASPVWQQSQ